MIEARTLLKIEERWLILAKGWRSPPPIVKHSITIFSEDLLASFSKNTDIFVLKGLKIRRLLILYILNHSFMRLHVLMKKISAGDIFIMRREELSNNSYLVKSAPTTKGGIGKAIL